MVFRTSFLGAKPKEHKLTRQETKSLQRLWRNKDSLEIPRLVRRYCISSISRLNVNLSKPPSWAEWMRQIEILISIIRNSNQSTSFHFPPKKQNLFHRFSTVVTFFFFSRLVHVEKMKAILIMPPKSHFLYNNTLPLLTSLPAEGSCAEIDWDKLCFEDWRQAQNMGY